MNIHNNLIRDQSIVPSKINVPNGIAWTTSDISLQSGITATVAEANVDTLFGNTTNAYGLYLVWVQWRLTSGATAGTVTVTLNGLQVSTDTDWGSTLVSLGVSSSAAGIFSALVPVTVQNWAEFDFQLQMTPDVAGMTCVGDLGHQDLSTYFQVMQISGSVNGAS